jgi:hypothetical protein
VKRVVVTLGKLFLLLLVTMMVRFQLPELRYDFGPHRPVEVKGVDDLSLERFRQPTFAAISGKPDLTKAAVYASHGVPFTYFLLEGYGSKIVVRTPELVQKKWADVDSHLGRLRPYRRMPFSRSVRSGFHQLFGMSIPEDAFFLARDDVPRPSGWNIGAIVYAGVLWCVLAYFFFLRRHVGRAFRK